MKPAHILGIIIIVALTLVGLTKTAHAQSSPSVVNNQQSIVNNNPSTPLVNTYSPNLSSDTPQNLQTFIQSVTFEFLGTISCILTGVNPVQSKGQCLGYNFSTGQLSYVNSAFSGGLVGTTAQLIGMTMQKPASAGEYLSYLSDNFGLTKKAYAQTSSPGFGLLNPIRNVWVVFRNLSYLLFVIILIFVGLGIMLRLQIDPRTVMSIQNQIPRVIIALILITFSYAIAGFLIDLMWITSYLVVQTFSNAVPSGGNSAGIQNMLSDPFAPAFSVLNSTGDFGILGIVSRSATAIGVVVGKIINGYLTGNSPESGILSAFIVGSFAGPAGPIVGGACQVAEILRVPVCRGIAGFAAGTTVAIFAGLVAWIVIFIAIWWALIRLWFSLIKAYIFIIVSILLSPFWIVAGLLPGSTVGFGAWLRDMIGNLAAFPTVFGLFALARIFMDNANSTNGLFIPPLIGGYSETMHIATIIGLGCILLAPEAVTMVRETIKAPTFKYATAIGRAIGIGTAGPTRIVEGGTRGLAYQATGAQGGALANILRGFGFIR